MKELAEEVLQLMATTDGRVGAGRYERNDERTTCATPSGPSIRGRDARSQDSQARYFLEPRRTTEQAWRSSRRPQGVSTRGDLVQAMGCHTKVMSELCDARVGSFLERPIEGEWTYLWLDATYLKVREDGRIVSIAAIIATGVNTDGRREILGMGLGPSEAAVFWLGSYGASGPRSSRREARHEGLKAAVAQVFKTTWQRCRVHFMRNALAYVPKAQHQMVAAAIRTVFAQDTQAAASKTSPSRRSTPAANSKAGGPDG